MRNAVIIFLAKHTWQCIGLVTIASIYYALYDTKETISRLKKERGHNRLWSKIKLVLIWAIPVFGGLVTVGAQAGADLADENIRTLEERGASLQTNIATIRKKMEHRKLTKQQVENFEFAQAFYLSHLEAEAGKKISPCETIITCNAADNETRSYAGHLRTLLDKAGYISTNYPVVLAEPAAAYVDLITHNTAGVIASVYDLHDIPSAPRAVVGALENIGIEVAWTSWPTWKLPTNALVLTVLERN